MSENDLSGKVGLDTTDFKSGIRSMDREIRVIESGFKASAAALGDWSKDASGLEMRIKALTSEMEVQKGKVAALRGEYERVAAEKGKDSIAAQNLEIQLNKATETMNRMGSELEQNQAGLAEMGQSAGDAGGEVDNLGKSADDASSGLEGLKTVAAGLGTALKAGTAAIAGLAAAVAGVGAAIGKLVFDSASAAAELVDLSTKTGIGTERLQEMSYVSDQVGTDLDTMTGAMSRLVRSMDTAREQEEKFDEALASGKMEDEISVPIEMAAAFNQLGVAFTDSSGNLRDNEAVFADLINALGKIPNETERDALAMQIFGKSAQELNPLIKAGSEELARLSQEARDMGAVMDGESVAALEAFDDQLSSLKAGLQGIGGTVATAFLPAFSGIAGKLQDHMKEAAGVVKDSDGDFGKMAEGFSGIFGEIAKEVAEGAPEALHAGLAIVKAVGSAIGEALPELITAGVEIIQGLTGFIVENLPMMMEAGFQILQTLIEAILPELPKLIEVGLQMITELMNGLAEALPTMIPTITKVVLQIVEVLVQNMPMLIEAALKLITALAEGLMAALPVMAPYIPKIVQAIYDGLVATLPILLDGAMQMIVTIAKGLLDNLPVMRDAAGKLVETFIGIFFNRDTVLGEAGYNIVMGVWKGISGAADWFRRQVEDFFSNIVDSVKNTLGIHSPSLVFAGIGENMIAGIGKGFEGEFGRVQRDIQGMANSLAPAAEVGLTSTPFGTPRHPSTSSGCGLGAAGSGALRHPSTSSGQRAQGAGSVNMGGIHITVYGATGSGISAEEIGRQAELGVRRQLRAWGLT